MSYYYCSSCDKRVELNHKRSHSKSELHMRTGGTVINKYTIMNPELCEINNIFINNVSNYNKRFEVYKIYYKCNLVFDNDISIHVKSKLMYTISVFCHSHEKILKSKINYRRQGLEFSHISEMNITFTTSLDFMTYKHYIKQPKT